MMIDGQRPRGGKYKVYIKKGMFLDSASFGCTCRVIDQWDLAKETGTVAWPMSVCASSSRHTLNGTEAIFLAVP